MKNNDFETMTVSFIGGGNMANALISGLVKKGFKAANINVVESDAAKRQQLQSDFGVRVTDQLPSVTQSDVVILAVKPQQLRDVSIFLGSLLSKQLLISIAAGVRSQDLARWLGGYQTIIRVMPNTPAQIQMGVSALYALPAVSAAQRASANSLLRAVGDTIWLDEEEKMDAVTAISGSGPAYVFYFIQAMQDAAIGLGLSPEQAKTLSLQTFLGASHLAAQSVLSPAELRVQVTSKGGTTEQALMSMETDGIRQSIIEAARAAAGKSRELGDLLGKN